MFGEVGIGGWELGEVDWGCGAFQESLWAWKMGETLEAEQPWFLWRAREAVGVLGAQMHRSLVMPDREGAHDFPSSFHRSVTCGPGTWGLAGSLTEGHGRPAPHRGHPHPRYCPQHGVWWTAFSLVGRTLLQPSRMLFGPLSF